VIGKSRLRRRDDAAPTADWKFAGIDPCISFSFCDRPTEKLTQKVRDFRHTVKDISPIRGSPVDFITRALGNVALVPTNTGASYAQFNPPLHTLHERKKKPAQGGFDLSAGLGIAIVISLYHRNSDFTTCSHFFPTLWTTV
jgi:hypothetical protein